ncbi:MAG TPA: hypothetical protein VGI45_09150 [Terracidiphilus sp.]|jgi:hypothetical protein
MGIRKAIASIFNQQNLWAMFGAGVVLSATLFYLSWVTNATFVGLDAAAAKQDSLIQTITAETADLTMAGRLASDNSARALSSQALQRELQNFGRQAQDIATILDQAKLDNAVGIYSVTLGLQHTRGYIKIGANVITLASIGFAILAYLRRGAAPQMSAAELEEYTDQDIGASSEPAAAVPIIFKAIKRRLRREIEDLGRRGNVNLAVGVVVTVAAVAVLVYLTQGAHTFTSTPEALQFYLPRITTVVLIETFSYFFLGLYRNNLAEIKYYQNERTTVEAMEIAWRSAAAGEHKGPEVDVIKQFVRTDRNLATKGLATIGDGTQNDALEIVKTLSKIVADSVKKGGKE